MGAADEYARAPAHVDASAANAIASRGPQQTRNPAVAP
jgi:hypothetical protein